MIPKICHIVAADKNRVMGNKGALPWHVPEDLKFFKQTTKEHVLIMGRKTFESIGHPLPKRFSIVVSRTEGYKNDSFNDLVISTTSLKEAFNQAVKVNERLYKKDTIFLLGGAELFKHSFEEDLVDQIYLTKIEAEFEGDCFYPEIPERFKVSKQWEGQSTQPALTFQFLEKK